MPTPAEIKKALLAAGLEVYRTRGDVVHVAERVRENLLMDSGVFLRASGPSFSPGNGAGPGVGFVVRAQRSDFPNEEEGSLFERARKLAAPAVERGYRETASEIRSVTDPGDANRTLDVWCEVTYEIETADVPAAIVEVNFAASLEKAAPTR